VDQAQVEAGARQRLKRHGSGDRQMYTAITADHEPEHLIAQVALPCLIVLQLRSML